jgi:hypothetical protein
VLAVLAVDQVPVFTATGRDKTSLIAVLTKVRADPILDDAGTAGDDILTAPSSTMLVMSAVVEEVTGES